MWNQIAAVSALASLVACAPFAPPHHSAPEHHSSPKPVPASDAGFTVLPQLARFDNDDGLVLVPDAPVNVYLDIFWQGMSLMTQGLDAVGVEPNSPSNYIGYGISKFPSTFS
jgi:hypothetical protein